MRDQVSPQGVFMELVARLDDDPPLTMCAALAELMNANPQHGIAIAVIKTAYHTSRTFLVLTSDGMPDQWAAVNSGDFKRSFYPIVSENGFDIQLSETAKAELTEAFWEYGIPGFT